MFILTIKTSVTFYNHLYLRGWLAILSMATNGKHESISIIFPTSDFLFRHFIDFDCSDFTQVAFNWHECKGRTLLAVICALCKVYSHFPSIHTTARGELSTPFGASKLQLQFQSIKREAKRMWTGMSTWHLHTRHESARGWGCVGQRCQQRCATATTP